MNATRLSLREAHSQFDEQARRSDHDGLARQRKIYEYMTLFKRPESSPTVTAVEFVDDFVVVDGNHTAMAAYVYALEQLPDSFELPLFVLRTRESVSVLG